jgi:chromosomal replication initiator protein
MVFACNLSMSKITNMNERLLSLLTRGLITEIQIPNYESRREILKSKVAAQDINVPEDVIKYLSKEIHTNISALNAAIINLIARSELQGEAITLENAKQYLKMLAGDVNL